MPAELSFELRRQGIRQRLGCGEQDGGSQWIVFCLSQKIRSDLSSVGRAVGDDQHFAGASEGVDSDLPVDQLFGESHVEISWPTDDIDARDGFGAQGKSRDRLGASDSIDLLHSCQVCCRQHRAVYLAIPSCRSDHHNLFHTGCSCRHCIHQHRARVGGPPTRYIETRSLHRSPSPSHSFAMNALHIEILWLLTLVKILDPTMGEFQGVSQI